MAAPDTTAIDSKIDEIVYLDTTVNGKKPGVTALRAAYKAVTKWATVQIQNASSWRKVTDGTGSVDENDKVYHVGPIIVGGNQDDGTNSVLQVRGTASMDGLFANNGDGQTPKTTTLSGQGVLRFFANLITGLSEFSLVNTNLLGKATAFWYMVDANTKALQLMLRGDNVGVGVINPQHRLEVAGRVKSAGLVAGGGIPVAIALTGLGGGSVSLRTGSTDQCGQIILVTGSNPTANDPIARITYSTVQPAEPVFVALTARNQLAQRDFTKVVLLTESNNSLVIFGSNNGSTLAPNSTYIYNYYVVV